MDHLIGYAGPEDAERAANAGIMLVNAKNAKLLIQKLLHWDILHPTVVIPCQ